MRLAAVDDILQFIRFDSIDEINASFDSALLTAGVSLSALLGTDFDRSSMVDTFYIESTRFIGQDYSVYLELNQGFVDSGQAVTVKYAETFDGLSTGTVISTGMVIDYEAGVVFISGICLDNLYVQVSYTAGFVASGNPSYYSNVPEWLKRTAIMQSVLEFDRMNPDFRKENSGVNINLTELQTYIGSMVEKHIRYNPHCVYTIM